MKPDCTKCKYRIQIFVEMKFGIPIYNYICNVQSGASCLNVVNSNICKEKYEVKK